MTTVINQSPVFILCSGHRSGSTLLQRIIIESGEIMIWGETGGAINHLSFAYESYRQMLGPGKKKFKFGLGGNGNKQRKNFFNTELKERTHLWIPCINPSDDIAIESFRKLFDKYYGQITKEIGFSRWGFKEVKSGLFTAKFLKKLYPKGKFIFLVREPISCMASIKRFNWMDHPEDKNAIKIYIKQWIDTAGSFRNANFGFLLRYEDLISKNNIREKLYNYLSIKGVSEKFFKKSRPRGNVNNSMKLTYYEKYKIRKHTNKIRVDYGY